MTGLEVVGLILAVLPLFVTASDHSKVFDPVISICQPRRRAERKSDFYTNFHYEVTILNLNVRRLFQDLYALPEAQRNSLMDDGNSELWNDPVVVKALQARLGIAYETFTETLAAILKLLEKLVNDKSNKLRREDIRSTSYAKLISLRESIRSGGSFSDLGKEIRFSMKEDRRNRLLDKISKNNEKLEHLLNQTADIDNDTEEVTRPRARHLDHFELRLLLHNLYSTLGRLWKCTCALPHEARLCLLKYLHPGHEQSKAVHFDMLMSVKSHAWLECEICILLRKSPPATSGVRFIDPSPTSCDKFDSESSTIAGSISTPTSTLPDKPVSNSGNIVGTICEVMKRAQSHKCCPHIQFDGEALSQAKPSLNRNSIVGSEPAVTLDELLRGRKKFTLRERRILAVILANSLLHFCDSPWLSKEWSKKHVSFFYKAKDFLDLKRPYLAIQFDEPEPAEDPDEMFRLHPNSSILALGILLLEIEICATIESQRCPDDLSEDGTVNVNTDLTTALRLYEETVDNLFVDYRNAIRACLDCNFIEDPEQSTSLEDESFRQAVCEHIVAPIENELLRGFNIRPEDIGLENA